MCKYFAEVTAQARISLFYMKKKIAIRFIFNVLLLCTLLSCSPGNRYVVIQGYAQGGTYSVKFNMKGEKGVIKMKPEAIKTAIDSILTEIDNTLSGYNKGSMLSRLNAGEEIDHIPGGMFEDIYSKAYEYYEKTGGALDVASGPLFDIWGFGFTSDSMPSTTKIQTVLAGCGMKRLKKDLNEAAVNGKLRGSYLTTNENPVRDEVENPVSNHNPSLNFNAIAQGYSCDIVAEYLYGLGVKDMLVDIGEIFCDGVNPAGKPWKVGIDRPIDGNETPGQNLDGVWESSCGPCGIVTSGNYRKFYIRDGKKYAHTIDPRTGYPVQHNLLSATIVAKDATTADAYATYCMVIGLEESMKFITSSPEGLEGYLIYADENGEMHEWASPGFAIVNQ